MSSFRSGALSRAMWMLLAAVLLNACDSSSQQNQGMAQGQDIQDGPSITIPPGSTNPDGGAGTGCNNSDPNHICLALKYVVYKDSTGAPIVDKATADTVVKEINDLWKACNLSFVLENYLAVDPTDYNLDYQTANINELTTIRRTFSDESTILAVTTGTWAGSLGGGSANAWTAMPGNGTYGAIMERPVATASNLIAHELGHYLNLNHVSDSSALMNPTIYSSSDVIYASQCNGARSAAMYFWPRMLR